MVIACGYTELENKRYLYNHGSAAISPRQLDVVVLSQTEVFPLEDDLLPLEAKVEHHPQVT